MARKPRKKVTKAAKPRSTPEPVLPGVNPAVDHDSPEHSAPFVIVGVGASAGGLDAMSQLLRALPLDTGMAFVVIQHLDPTYPSRLAEILGRETQLPVQEARHQVRVEPNHVYVIAPGKDMVLGHGWLQLSPRTEIRGVHRPVDKFLRSLAEEQGHKSMAVILSGSGNDGSAGVQEVKGAGGIVFAQDGSAEHSNMPLSAVATGCVDFTLPPADIAAEIGRIARHPLVAPEQGDAASVDDPAIARVLDLVRNSSGVDFSDYKRNTLHRRIKRRMVLHRFHRLHDYVELLQRDPVEAEALFRDVLINVTSFFRNPEAFEALKSKVFPRLLADKSRHDQLRVWALGCSTGEEAYSIAMTYSEFAEASGRRVPLQIFATDLNAAGIEKARAGIYPKGIEQDVTPERLRRFFVEVDGSYRVSKPIRDMCIFAPQNVLADPPFSRMDLIACRNLLIYLQPVLQQRLLPVLHYALRESGVLWLGSSETIGGFRDLFEAADPKAKLYLKKPGRRPATVPLVPRLSEQQLLPRVPGRGKDAATGAPPDVQREADRLLLARYAPVGVVVNADLDIVQFRGDTSAYLMPAPGKASLNLMKMLREGLLIGVRGAVHRAQREKVQVREAGLRVAADGGDRKVDVLVLPLNAASAREHGFLVLFEEPAAAAAAQAREAVVQSVKARSPKESEQQELVRLRQELAATRDYLQSVIEQQEAANEELQAVNEEAQSANEELQSINEELETSKEEIQSSNEELATVNDELGGRNRELTQSNNDLNNLFASVQMAILMLGRDLRIRRFTPLAEKIFNLIGADVGRPITDIKLNLDIPDFERVLLEVIDSVVPKEWEIRARDGRWFLLRLRPYKTTDNQIDGVVVVLLDIDAFKRSQEARREQAYLLDQTREPILMWSLDGTLVYWNRGAEETYGYPRDQVLGHNVHRLLQTQPPSRVFLAALQEHGHWAGELLHRREDGQQIPVESSMVMAKDAEGTARVVETARPILERKLREDTLRQRAAELAAADRSKNEFIAVLAHELRNPLAALRSASELVSTEGIGARAVGEAKRVIDEQTRHMTRMVDDLLDIARISHGTIRLNPQRLDLADVLRSSVAATEHQRSRGQELHVTLPREPVFGNADPMRVQQLISNLLSNAAKFTGEGGNIWLSLEAAGDDDPGWALIRVRDDGEGISPQLLPRVFDMFTTTDDLPERGRSGLGIGLALARRLAELHGGTIEARSAGAGCGSEFRVRLPLADPPAQALAPPADPVPPKTRRVLIVDDQADAARMMQILLETVGHVVEVAHDGASAVQAARAFAPEVVLLDIGLPGEDGYQVAARLRAEPALEHVRLIAVTGYGRAEDIRHAQAAGFDAHMTKPVDPEALRRAVSGEGRSPAPGPKGVPPRAIAGRPRTS